MQNNSSCNSIWYDYGHHEGLDTETRYIIHGYKANFCLFTKSLQVIFKIIDRNRYKIRYILQEYEINSKDYYQFIDYLYAGSQEGIIEVNESNVDSFCCYGNLKYVNEHYEIDFNLLEPISPDISEAYTALSEE